VQLPALVFLSRESESTAFKNCMNRRLFLCSTAALAFAPRPAKAEPRKVPFRVLYSNDTTNVSGCVSPWHKAGEPFRPSMLEASVDEVAGKVDAHFLQPGLGMVPMWPSKVLPLEAHYAWIKERYKVPPDSFGKYVLGGGDVVKVFIDRCRKTGQAPFISFRLNDAHHKEFAFPQPGDKPGTRMGMSVTRHYVEHPEFILKQGSKCGADVVQNWLHPEVRAQKLALLTELCENYDLDGIELDFMRFDSFFDQAQTTRDQRCEVITGFVRQVRTLLDRTAREGKRRWLCARVPGLIKGLDYIGLDLAALVTAGLDMVNASASYFTTQQMDLAAIRKRSEGAALYVELCHSIENGPKLTTGYDTFAFRRATKEQLQTTAHLGYSRGAQGVSLFNFAYYRPHGGPGRGEFSEPPFEVLRGLGDPAMLARQPQHWFFAKGWNNAYQRPPLLPRKLATGQKTVFHLDMAPPAEGWKGEGRLRVQCEESLESRTLEVRLDGKALETTADVSEPFANPNGTLLGKPEHMRAWTVPAAVLVDGKNAIEVWLASGEAVAVHYLDLRMG